MSTEQSQSYDPKLVDEARQQIRGLVHEIERIAQSAVGPDEFFEGFLSRLVSALAATGGAVWMFGEGGGLELSYQINLRQALPSDEKEQMRHGRLLQKVLKSGEGLIVPPQSGTGDEDGSGNPTEYLMVVGPLRNDQQVQGVVEVFQRPGGRPTVERGYLRFLMQMCEVAGDYLKTRRLRHFADRQVLWTQLETFTRLVHKGLDPRQTAYTIANEGRRLIECDRVSVALRRGRKCPIEAVSGQETFDKRSNTVRLLGNLASAVVATGEPVWYNGDTTDLAPQVEEAVQAYIDESHAKTVAVLPLKEPREPSEELYQTPPEVIGALIVEQIDQSRSPDGLRERVDVVCEHSSTALANSLEHQQLFLMPLWRALGKARWIVSARTLPKTLGVLGLIAAAVLALIFIPADFEVEGKGTLQPVVRQEVFADVGGEVMDVLVKHGSMIKKGDVLVKLRNNELDIKAQEIFGQLDTVQKQLESLRRQRSDTNTRPEDRYRLPGEIQALEVKLNSLISQRDLLREQQKLLEVRSPIDGQVITWQVEELLRHRPVDRGQRLLVVADPSQAWQLEVNMPEDRIGYVNAARAEFKKEHPNEDLPVSYILANDPGRTHEGEITEIHQVAETHNEDGNTVLVKVGKINKDDIEDLRNGVGVTARVDCGTRSLGFVWFHDLISFIESKVLFRL